jgi:2-aminoadipate transaminase
VRSSAIRDLLAVTAQPDVISFAGGLPAPELFPVEALRVSFDAVFRTEGAAALQYGPTEGHLPLRVYLAEQMAALGMPATPDEILITTGSQQALDLLGKVLLPRDSVVLVEAPSYVGALQAFTIHEPSFLTVPMDDEGLLVDQAAAVLAGAIARPSLLYTVATFQNPSGVTMSLPRRQALLALCNDYGIPLVEDNPYGELRYEGETLPPFRALPGGEDAIYLGTFSKILAPGLRVGYVVAPSPLIARMVMAKQGADLHTDSLAQRAILHYLQHNDLPAQIERLRSVYRERRDAMLTALAGAFPAEVRFTHPEGGLFTWVALPDGSDCRSILADALRERVAFVPGDAFFADGRGTNTFRLNFSHCEPARIQEGVRRLGRVLSAHLRQPVRV